MKIEIRWFLFIALLQLPVASYAGGKNKVNKVGDATYWEELDAYKRSDFIYHVDAKAKLCFAIFQQAHGGTGITSIPCEALWNRPEWAQIITWVGKE